MHIPLYITQVSISQRCPAPLILLAAPLPASPHHANGWGDEKPTVFDDGPRPIANHIFNVIIETLSTYRKEEGCLAATREGGQQSQHVQSPASPLFEWFPEGEAVTSA